MQSNCNNKRPRDVSFGLFVLFLFFYVGNCWESIAKLKTVGIKGTKITRTLDFQNRVYIEDLESWTYDFFCKATYSGHGNGDNETLLHAFYTLEKIEKSSETFKRVNLTTVNPQTFLETFFSLSGPVPRCLNKIHFEYPSLTSLCEQYPPRTDCIQTNKYSNNSISTFTMLKEPDLNNIAFLNYPSHISDIRNNIISNVPDIMKNLYREKYNYTLTILNTCINEFLFH